MPLLQHSGHRGPLRGLPREQRLYRGPEAAVAVAQLARERGRLPRQRRVAAQLLRQLLLLQEAPSVKREPWTCCAAFLAIAAEYAKKSCRAQTCSPALHMSAHSFLRKPMPSKGRPARCLKPPTLKMQGGSGARLRRQASAGTAAAAQAGQTRGHQGPKRQAPLLLRCCLLVPRAPAPPRVPQTCSTRSRKHGACQEPDLCSKCEHKPDRSLVQAAGQLPLQHMSPSCQKWCILVLRRVQQALVTDNPHSCRVVRKLLVRVCEVKLDA